MMAPFPWWPIALAELGVSEIPGSRHNPRVLEYLRSTTLGADMAALDETAWCSAFANWCIQRAGLQGTGSAWARSWLQWGEAAPLQELRLGAIVVLSRGDMAGHVGFLHRLELRSDGPPLLHLLGGNQGNAVKVSPYPANQLLGIRVPPQSVTKEHSR